MSASAPSSAASASSPEAAVLHVVPARAEDRVEEPDVLRLVVDDEHRRLR